METKHRTEVEYSVAIQKSAEEVENEQIGILADILFEAFMWQVEGKKEESKAEKVEKKTIVSPREFYF